MIRSDRASLLLGQSRRQVSDDEDDLVVSTRAPKLSTRSRSMDAVSAKDDYGDRVRGGDFLRLDNYELEDEKLLVADDDFFMEQRTPTRTSLSSFSSHQQHQANVTQVAVDKTPIMLMKQMNRLSESPNGKATIQRPSFVYSKQTALETTTGEMVSTDDSGRTARRAPMSNEELLKRVLESREKFKRTVAATISRKNLVSEDELSDDTRELIAETKKDLGEIEKVVSEYQHKQEEMKRFVGRAEAEVERLEREELKMIKDLSEKAAVSKFSFAFWMFMVVLIAFLVAVLQWAPIDWEVVEQTWVYAFESVAGFLGLPKTANVPY